MAALPHQQQVPLNEQHAFHSLIVSWGAVPKVFIANEVFYDTKAMFPKHNLGRDVARYCDDKDWYKSKKRFFLNARGVVALAFGKRIPQVRQSVFELVGLMHRPGATLSREPVPVGPEIFGASRSMSPFVAGSNEDMEQDENDEDVPRQTPIAAPQVKLQVQLPPPGVHGGDEEEDMEDDFDNEDEMVLPTPPLQMAMARNPFAPIATLNSGMHMAMDHNQQLHHHQMQVHQQDEWAALASFPQYDYVDDELASIYYPTLNSYYPNPNPNPTPMGFVSAPMANAYSNPRPVYAHQPNARPRAMKRVREEYLDAGQYDEEPMYKMQRTAHYPTY